MARSFSAICGPDGLLQHLADLRTAVPGAAGGIVFVSGQLAQRAAEVAELVRTAWRGTPACVVPARGVLSERGELEGQTAASGVLWAGGQVTPFALPEKVDEPRRMLRETLVRVIGHRSATAILFARAESFAPDMLDALAFCAPNARLFGAGTAFGSAVSVTAQGDILEGSTAGLVITGFAPPIVDASPAGKLISDFWPIEEARGGLVLRVGGRPVLDRLSDATSKLGAQAGPNPLVFAAIADVPTHADGGSNEREVLSHADPGTRKHGAPEPPHFLLRPIRGVDPAQRALLIGDEARPGAQLAFAVRDAAAARAGLEAVARQVSRSALGSAPRFALYLSCAGRGQGLHGAPDVEARILRHRFADLPIAGMHSAFEIVPWGPGQARLALYTGVLALFRAPS